MIRSPHLVLVAGGILLLAACSDPESDFPLDAVAAPDSSRDGGADAPVPDLARPDLIRPDTRRPDLGWPAGCPANLKGLTGQALRKAIFALVDGHNSIGYNISKKVIFIAAEGGLDRVGNQVECVYTGRKEVVTGTKIPSSMNVEHTWPQSMGASKEPARGDLHHLFPCDAKANSRRGNHPFGEPDCANCTCNWTEGGSTLGYAAGCTEQVFKVRASRKGDIARAKFYFALRYLHDQADAIPAAEEKVLRAWHAADPVDARELKRNGGIAVLQNKRNPFVDCPLLVTLLADF